MGMKFLIRKFCTKAERSSGCLTQVLSHPNRTPRRWYFQLSTPRKDPSAATSLSGDPPKRPPTDPPAYYNFSTLAQQDAHLKRPRRSSSGFVFYGDRPSMEAAAPADAADPHWLIHLSRRDTIDVHTTKAIPLSVDVSVKKFLDMFCDYDAKRCKLCNESFMSWHTHQNGIPHSGREALLMEMVRPYCGTPEAITQMWWDRLHASDDFRRIPNLSHADPHRRKRRLQYLLRFLTDRGVLRDAFNVHSNSSGAGRSWEFERLEWMGDNVVKYMFNNRLSCIFPVNEGGIRGKLGYAQFIIDGNDGLARAYDYLELQQLTQSDRVVSKFKSDVVETLFGELEVYLWSTELDLGTTRHAIPFGKDIYAIRALVGHTMEELGHVMFMYHVDHLLGALRRIIRENQLQLVRADPSLRGQNDAVQELAGSLYHTKKASILPCSRFTAQKIIQNHQVVTSLYNESTNYEKFKRVTPLGGLEPFPLLKLDTSSNFTPHLQNGTNLSERLDPLWSQGPYFSFGAKNEDSTNTAANTSRLGIIQEGATGETFYRLKEAPTRRRGKPVLLNLYTSLDENLITELI
ncbi:unnamed protein product [Phytomonas sp. Hart1]|nr:unnamed protein product [Phytomonas sp. Hart1]|eukprot:CCW67043.1 unnamed protein product [Phytomonas sp. isolate Hart1]